MAVLKMALAALVPAAALALLATPANAQFTTDNYSWVNPSWTKKKVRRSRYRPAAKPRQAPRPYGAGYGWSGGKKKTYQGASPKRSVKNKVLSGGPKPYIAAKRPPVVRFAKRYTKGSIVIDTAGRKLYYVLGKGRAYRYPIAVGKRGFAWSGTTRISAKKSWPDWRPPKEMRKRKPNLPKVMHGGLYNPLGAKALYLGKSLYRIHGTNNSKSIGTASSSGCFRMLNSHVTHLSKIAGVGTKVYVKRKL